MKLRELVEKIDNDIVLWIVRAPDTDVLFKRETASDVIPENLLCMEVGTFFPGYGRLHIEVKRNSKKIAFENCLTVSIVTLVSTYTSITVTAQKKRYILKKLYFAQMKNMTII